MSQGRTVARYAIRVRDASRTLIGEVDAFTKLGIVERYNAVSDWALELDAAHPMAPLLATKGYGVEIVRQVVDADTDVVLATRVELSGPMRHIERGKQDNRLLVAGKDDTMWLAARDAWPVTTLPYSAFVLGMPGLLRSYRLGESSGTSATDSKSGQTGTYSGSGITLAQAALVDDLDTCVDFDGAAGNVSIPTSGLPTGNGAFWLAAWVNGTSFADANSLKIAVGFGTNSGAGSAPFLGVRSSGIPCFGNFLTTLNAAVTINTGETHFLLGTWDGTTRKIYVDGALSASDTPAAYSISLVNARIAASNSGTGNLWNGRIDEVMMGGTSLPSDTDIANLYALGLTRFSQSAYDAQGPAAAETVLRHYVDVNAGPSAILERQVSGLTLAADAGQGASVKGNARFDPLVSKDGNGLLQQLALAGGVGFRVVQSGTNLEFQVYTPQDKTAVAKFSDDLGNLADYAYALDAPDLDSGGNVVVVGGSGEGTARIFLIGKDAGSITSWGRAEAFVDARDTADTATLSQRASDALAQTQEQTTFTSTLAPVESMVYGIDYSLGDKVTVVVDGAAFSDIVREVEITVDRSGAETVVPAVGTVNAAAVQRMLSGLQRQVQLLRARIDRLERTQ